SSTAAALTASLRPHTATEAPARTSPRAMPSPMPRLPPVTTTTLPVRSDPAPEVPVTSALPCPSVTSGLLLHFEQHFAAHGAGLELLDRLAGLFERIGPVDDGVESAGDEVVPHRFPLAGDEPRVRPERGAPAHPGHTHIVEQETVDPDLRDVAC